MKSIILTIKEKINSFFQRELHRKSYKRATIFIKNRPLGAFFIALGFLFIVILIGHTVNTPKPEIEAGTPTKMVHTFSIGETPKSTFEAKIDKAGVIKIVALSSGVVQSIAVSEGDSVYQGTQILTLSSNYQGGSTPALQAQIADKQYQNAVDSEQEQKDAIQKQRDITNITHDNFTDQQKIATQSASDTNSLINANQTILDTLNQQLSDEQSSGASPSALVQSESTINQLQGAQNQLRQQLSNLQEQTDGSKAPGQLADAQRDLAMKQLDLQEKALELNVEVSKLQTDMADVSASAMLPVSPFNGTVERIYVRVGEQVNPGTQLAEISSNDKHATAVVLVPQNIVENISKLDASTLHIGDKSYSVRPIFIASEATDGQLFAIAYAIPNSADSLVTDGTYLSVDVPIGSVNTLAAAPFVPLDAVFQTQNSDYLLIMKNHRAVTRQVTLGSVFASFVAIVHGLTLGDQVITDRNVVVGDKVDAY